MRVILLIIASLLLTVGCSTLTPQVMIPAKEEVIKEIDAQCVIVRDPFYQGVSDRIYSKTTQKQTLTVEQYREIAQFKKFCAMEDKTAYDYGYWAAGEAQIALDLFLKGLKIAGVTQ